MKLSDILKWMESPKYTLENECPQCHWYGDHVLIENEIHCVNCKNLIKVVSRP